MKMSPRFENYIKKSISVVVTDFCDNDIYLDDLRIDSFGSKEDAQEYAEVLREKLIEVIKNY